MKKLQRGLPKGRYSKYGYKRNSPDVNKPFNIIPSGNITMKDVDFPVKGIDNLGNEQIMYPGLNYIFPGSYVLEIPMMQPGGQTNNDREMVKGIADILTMVKDPVNRRQIAAEMVRDFKREGVKYDLQEFQKMAQVRMQRGGLKFQQYYTPAAESTGANYTPTMTVQAAERLKTQRDAQELTRRRQAIQASQAAASKPLKERLTPENLAQETGATGDKLRFFPNDPDSFIDDYLNPLKMVGDMASGLGRIPLNVKQGNYGAAALDVAIPVATGALAGLGAKSAGQFVNNLANPLAGTGNLAANAAAKSSFFGNIASGLQNLGYISDQSLGYLFNNRANKKAIAEGNEWLRNWIQHPTTQAKIDKDFAGKINNSFVKNMYDVGYEQAKNFTPVSTELPLSVQLTKGFYPNKGNWGVSYLHHVDPMRRRMIEQGQMDAPIWHGSFISKTLDLPYKKRVGTTIHEGTHDWTSKFGLEASGQREFLERNINPEIHQDLEYWRRHGDDKTKTDLGKKRRYQAYLADPTEQHARIMELRKYLGHTPDFVSTPEYAQKVMDDLSAMRKNKRPIDSEGLFKVIDNDPQKLNNMFNRLWGAAPVAVAGAAAVSEKKYGGKLPKYQDKGSVQPRKNNKIYSFLGDMIDSAEKATNETSKFLGDILAPITPDYKTEEEREMLFRRHRPVLYPGIVAGLKDIYIDYTNKKTGNPYLDNFIQNYTVEQKKPFLDEKGDYNIAEEAWRMSLGLPVKNKYIKKSNYRPLNEKDKNSKYYTLNNVIDYNALRNKVKELKIKPGNFVQMESLSPFIKDKFMNKEEFAEIDPLQRFKLGVNKKGKMYIWDKYDFNFAPLQKVIEPYQYEFYDEFQNGGMMQRKDLPKAQSLGEFIPSWANPMNWNVEDYSDKTDFNKAYSAAKKAGKEEFMFNGKRYNTKYAGTPRQEVGVYGVQGKPVHHMNLNDPAQVNLYPAFGKYLPGHISASIGDNQTSVDYSRIGNYPYGINKVKNKGEKSFNVYGQDNLTFSNKVASLPTGNYFVEDKYRPSDWNLFTNNCADNVCDAFGIPRSKGIQTPKAAMQKIQKKYPTLDVTGRRYDDYYDLGVKLRPISFHRPDEVLNQTKNLVGILSSPDLNNTKASEKITFALQNALLKKGYKLPKSINKDGELDGILGDETKAALEDWQKKNSKKQLGGALLKAQFGAFGTIPTSPPFMPQKENVVTSKKVDNLPKIKVNTTVPDEMITIKDGRKIRLTTGQAINPNTDLVGKSYSTKALRSILNTAKNRGLSKNDALTLAAMDLQETRWGETDNNMGHVIYKNGFARSPAENFINAYLKSKETADRLKLSDEYTRLQVYNGLGKITPDTEKNCHGFRMKKIYGVPVPKSGIDMKKNPLYGKQIVDIRDNVLKQNSEFLKLVDEYYKMGGITNEMLDVYKNYINGVYTNTEKEKDAIKVYDKLNRKYYREAKNANKSVPNYIMSLIK